MPVATELIGDDGRLRGSSFTEGPGGSLCVLIATTYSYVVMPYKKQKRFSCRKMAGIRKREQ